MNHFFDVGACIGQTFDNYLCKDDRHDGWTVWCFEPSLRHLPQLCSRIEAVKTRYSIVLCPFGLSGINTTAPFYVRAEDWQGDSFSPNLYTLGQQERVSLKNLDAGYRLIASMASLPDFILAHTDPKDTIELKLDCEGGEFTALPALLNCQEALKRVSALLVEFHDNGPDWCWRMNRIKAGYAHAGKPIQDWNF